MGVQRRTYFEGGRLSCEVPQTNQMPVLPAIFGHLQLIAADVKGVRSQPFVVFTLISRSAPSTAKL